MNKQRHSKPIIPIILATLLFLIAALLFSYGPQHRIWPEAGIAEEKPDLIIEEVLYEEPSSSMARDSYDPAFSGAVNFTIVIKNIGNAPLAVPFYVSVAKSSSEIAENNYSTTLMVNPEAKLLPPRETIKTKMSVLLAKPYPEKLRFLIDTTGRILDNGISIPRVEESDYRNNMYDLKPKKTLNSL